MPITPWLAPVAMLTSQLVHRHGASRLDHTDGGITRRTDRMAHADAALPLSSTGCYSCVTVANLRIQRGMTGWRQTWARAVYPASGGAPPATPHHP